MFKSKGTSCLNNWKYLTVCGYIFLLLSFSFLVPTETNSQPSLGWAHSWGGSANDQARGLALAPTGEIYQAGGSQGGSPKTHR